MPSKTSCSNANSTGMSKRLFNKTIFIKNICRFWPLWGGYLLILLLMLPFSTYVNYMNGRYYSAYDFNWNFCSLLNVSSSPLIISFVACFVGIAVFSYLFNARSAYAIHALPVTREELFVTNYLSGFTFLVVPQFITYVVTALVTTGFELQYFSILGKWFLVSVAVSFFFYSFAVLICQLSGNIVCPAVLFYIFNFLYVGLKSMLYYFTGLFVYGINLSYSLRGKDSYLSPLYALLNTDFFIVESSDTKVAQLSTGSDLHLVYFYALFAILLIAAAVLLYHYRHIESAGDIISVRFLRPVFQIGVTFCGTLLMTLGVISIFLYDLHVGSRSHTLLVFVMIFITSLIAFFATKMILQKSFKVFNKKSFRNFACVSAVFLLAFAIVRFDLLGISAKVPKSEDVASVSSTLFYTLNYTDSEHIDAMIDIHKDLVANKEELIDGARNDYTYEFELVYKMKDGSTLARQYAIPHETNLDFISRYEALVNDYDTIVNMFDLTDISKLSSVSGYCEMVSIIEEDGYSTLMYDASVTLGEIDCKNILTAYLLDVQEGNIIPMCLNRMSDPYHDELYVNAINICYKRISKLSGYSNIYGEYNLTAHNGSEETDLAFYVNKRCVHTLQALQDAGIHTEEFVTLSQVQALNKTYD